MEGDVPMRSKIAATIFGALVATVMTAFAGFAASDYEGVWAVQDTDGKAFEITLSADGKAAASHPKGMTGSWKEDGGAAVISWSSGWTTKIAKSGDKYVKTAFKKGEPLDRQARQHVRRYQEIG